MALTRYREKRDPERTPEPFGGQPSLTAAKRSGAFVIQQHAARRMHYDFRLEMEGVLRSWAVPKGPSLNPRDRHLAVMVEDHPLEYGDFEGIIPPGNYGAGPVIVWDRGIYTALLPAGDVAAAIAAGKLDFTLSGYKLRGAFTLVRSHGAAAQADGKQQWLLIKKRDEYANDDDVLARHPRSVLSGLAIDELARAGEAGAALSAELARLGAPRLAGELRAPEFPPMLAELREQPVEGPQWLYEFKYDGVRALALGEGGARRLFARSGSEITAAYPEVSLALRALPYQRFAFDGEVVALDAGGRPDFQLLQRRMHLRERRDVARLSLEVPVRFFIFDLLAFDNFDLRPLPLVERKRLLSGLIRGEGALRFCEHYRGSGRQFLEAVSQAGLEGMMAKRRDAPYRGRRSADWIKIKCPLRRCFVIGGYTDPAGSRLHFGALLLGVYDADGALRFVDKVGTGFDRERLGSLHALMGERARSASPFRPSRKGEPVVPRQAHFCEPTLVCEVRFAEWTNHGGIRHPSFLRLIEGADPRDCRDDRPPGESEPAPQRGGSAAHDSALPLLPAQLDDVRGASAREPLDEPGAAFTELGEPPRARAEHRRFSVTHPEKILWPESGFTKRDLVEYYLAIADWMLPYLKDRPVMMTRYPDGIAGKMFYQKDAPGFAPNWLRTAKIWSHDSERELSYFILDSADALGYVANLAAITIHIWSSRLPHLENPDWLLFDIDPKGTTTERAISVAQETCTLLEELGLRPALKTSGQAGFHVVVGLEPRYTYEQCRMFSELAARLIVGRVPELATINRNPDTRKGKVYIDFLQLGHGKTIAAPFSVRPLPGAPVSTPLRREELQSGLEPARFNIRTMVARMAALGHDPFLGALEGRMRLEQALPRLEHALSALKPERG